MKLIFFFLTILIIPAATAQIETPLFFSVQSKSGFLIAHRSAMSHLVEDRNVSFEMSLSQQITNYPLWSTVYKKPLRGISFSYQDFGNNDILGKGFSLFQHTSFPLLALGKFGFIDFRLGSGISYINKKYDVVLDPKNNAIGSHINAIVNIQYAWMKYFNKWHIGAGIEMTHYSNASLIQPNLGLNTPMLFMTLGFNPERRESPSSGWKEKIEKGFENEEIPNAFNFSLITTGKQNLPGSSKSKFLPVIAFQGIYSHNISMKWNFETGIDIIYNEANHQFYNELNYSVLQTFQLGLYVGGAANILKTQIYFGLGGYIVNTINPAGHFYNRIGYRYHFNSNWNGMIGIMANLGKADYLEVGFGYRIKYYSKADRKKRQLKESNEL